MKAFLGMGSNVGDRRAILREAVAAIPELVAVSPVYETDPVGGPEQGPFYNIVVELETDRSPQELLALCHELEQAAGRVRVIRWGPRTLDVDVLLVGDLQVDDENLTVPHARMADRNLRDGAATRPGAGPDGCRLRPDNRHRRRPQHRAVVEASVVAWGSWQPPSSMPPESRPSTPGDDPPPPGAAQGLVARAGFVVYEGGRSVFDESVLVYIAHHQRSWPNAEVVDHVGRPLGAVRRRQTHGLLRTTPLFRVTDPAGGKLFDIVAKNRLLSRRYVVTGVAAVTFRFPEQTITAGEEPVGSIDGKLIGASDQRFTVLDNGNKAVAVIQRYSRGNRWVRDYDYVTSIDPVLRGELRRAIIAAPVALEQARHAEQSAS